MDIKCACGKYSRVCVGIEWLCWECRAIVLKNTPEEDWRENELRASAKKLKLGRQSGETDHDIAVRSRVLFKELVKNMDKSVGYD